MDMHNRKRTVSWSGIFELRTKVNPLVRNADSLLESADEYRFHRNRRRSFDNLASTDMDALLAGASVYINTSSGTNISTASPVTVMLPSSGLSSATETPNFTPSNSRKISCTSISPIPTEVTKKNSDTNLQRSRRKLSTTERKGTEISLLGFNSAANNPPLLSSNLVKKYLANLAVYSNPIEVATATTNTIGSNSPECGLSPPLLPSYLQLQTPLASTTLSMLQSHHPESIGRSIAKKATLHPPPKATGFGDGDKLYAWTDFAASSEASEAEQARGFMSCGYMSDTCAVAAEVERIRLVERHLDSDLLRDKAGHRTRTYSGGQKKASSNHSAASSQRSSAHSSSFDLTHLYDGLKPDSKHPFEMFRGPGYNTKSSRGLMSPSVIRRATDTSSERGAIPSVGNQQASSPSSVREPTPRWRSLLTDQFGLKRQQQDVNDDPQSYLVDQKAVERRIRGQTSNLLTPVFF